MTESWTTSSPQETRNAAARVLRELNGQGVLLLEGDLGAGKTCFVQGLAEAMGITDPVTSPTYGLMKEYGSPPCLVHADLYRLTDPEELVELGLEDWLDQPLLLAVEWPERVPDLWPQDAWVLRITPDPDHEEGRTFHLHRRGTT